MKNLLGVEPYAINRIGDKIIFSDKYTRGFFFFDREEGCVRHIGSMNRENCNGMDTGLFYRCVTTNLYAIFIPHHADALALWNEERESIIEILLPNQYKGILGKFSCGLAIQDKIFMFGFNVNGIIVLNTSTNSISKLEASGDELPKYTGGEGNKIRDAISVENLIYFVSLCSNALFRLDTSDNTVESISLQVDCTGFVSIIKYNHKLFLIPTEGRYIIDYDTNTGDYCVREMPNVKGKSTFLYGKAYKSRIFLFSREHEDVLSVNLNEFGDIVEYNIENSNHMGEGIFLEGCYYAGITDKREMIKIDVESGKYEVFELNKGYINHQLYRKEFSRENNSYGLREFIFGVSG